MSEPVGGKGIPRLGGQGQLLGPGPARHPVCDEGSVQVHVETKETLLVKIEQDRPISLGTSQSNHAIQERSKLGRHQGLYRQRLGWLPKDPQVDIGRHRRFGRSRRKLELNSTFHSIFQPRSGVQCSGESCRGGNRTPVHPQRLWVRDIGGSVHRLVCGKINCEPHRGRKREAQHTKLLWIL